MSFIINDTDALESLLKIGIEHELNIKKAQDAAPTQLLTRLFSGLKAQLSTQVGVDKDPEIFIRDLKDLASYIQYCATNELQTAGLPVVIRAGQNAFESAQAIGLQFDKMTDEQKSLYADFPKSNPQYHVYKEGIARHLQELLDKAKVEKNKLAEVIIGKLRSEADSLLDLASIPKKLTTLPAGGGEEPIAHAVPAGPDGKPVEMQDASQTSTQTSTEEKQVAQWVFAPIQDKVFQDEYLDLEVMRLFYQNILTNINQPLFSGWLIRLYHYDVKNDSSAKGQLDATKNRITEQARQGLQYVMTLKTLLPDRIQADALNITGGPKESARDQYMGGAGPGLLRNFMSIMSPGNNTPRSVSIAANRLIQCIRQIQGLLPYLTKNNAYIQMERTLGNSWIQDLSRVLSEAEPAAAREASQLK